jgi:TPR repeat protein
MHGLRDCTYYIECGSTEKLIASIVALCEREGMQRVDACQGKLRTAPALECNNWSVMVLPGAPGWHVVSTAPWDLLSDRAVGANASRLFALCEALRVAGFALHVSDGDPWGQVLLEAGGCGRQSVSGWWHEASRTLLDYPVAPQDAAAAQPHFQLLESLQTLLEDGRDFRRCGIRADSDHERACEHIARQLGGVHGDAWPRWDEKPGASTVLHFTWPARDRPEPPPSEYELVLQEFNSAPRYFYADGSQILEGDAVLFDGGRFPGRVTGFLIGNEGGAKLYAASVLVHDGEPGSRTVAAGPRDGGRFAALQFIERDTRDFMKAGVGWLEKRSRIGDPVAQFHLGNLFATGIGVAEDQAQCATWWRKSADKGYALAQYWLGNSYHYGRGVPADPVQSARWWRKAADQGLAEAQCNLGAAHEHGTGVARNLDQALFWYRKSAAQGLETAKQRLAQYEEKK